jgi:hypothetical protein
MRICIITINIPTLIYSWQHKITGVYCDIFNEKLENYILDDYNFSSGEIIKNMRNMIENLLVLK